MVRFFVTCVLLSLCLPMAGHAQISKANSKTLIANINRTLSEFADKSGVKITYQDVTYYDEPLIGSYLSFIQPKITLSYGATYEFSVRNIALQEDGDDVMKLIVPPSFNMRQITSGSVNDFTLKFNGVPKLLFRVNEALAVNHYQIDAPDSVGLLIQQVFKDAAGRITSKGARGRMQFNSKQWRSNRWHAINPLKASDITGFMDAMGKAF